jgi:hypothetical protein
MRDLCTARVAGSPPSDGRKTDVRSSTPAPAAFDAPRTAIGDGAGGRVGDGVEDVETRGGAARYR